MAIAEAYYQHNDVLCLSLYTSDMHVKRCDTTFAPHLLSAATVRHKLPRQPVRRVAELERCHPIGPRRVALYRHACEAVERQEVDADPVAVRSRSFPVRNLVALNKS